MLVYLANIAYTLMLCAFVTRDVLYLRSLLVVAQSLVVFYTWRNGVPLISAWNGLFALINLFMVAQILRERRRVELPSSLRELYERHFSALSPPEFLRWWNMGQQTVLRNELLVADGAQPQWLYFLLSGRVRVKRPGGVVELPSGYLVGEMSLLTGKPANADVDAIGSVEVMRWPTRELHALRDSKPALWTRIQAVIGRDLVEKIQRAEHEIAQVPSAESVHS